MPETDSPFYEKEDEHVVLLIKQNQRFCQQTMTPMITAAQKTAERAHDRVDKMETRMNRLDDKEMGKVSILWRDRKMLIAVIGIVLLNLVLQFVRIGGGNAAVTTTVSQDAIKSAVKSAVEDSIKDLKGIVK